MSTLREIVYNIKNLMGKGLQSDDQLPSDRQYAFMVDYYRAKIVKESIEKNKSISPYIQNLGSVELIEADPHECCDGYDCILRTKRKIPDFITANGKEVATYVGTRDKSFLFQQTYYTRSYWDAFARYTGNMPKWYYQSPYLYILNPPDPAMRMMNIQGVFEDPEEAENWRDCECEGTDCKKGLNFEYPFEDNMLDVLYKMMIQTELNLLLTVPEDQINDTATTESQRLHQPARSRQR